MAQKRIDSTLAFQKHSGKKFSLFVPKGYVPSEKTPVLLALHPFNPALWDAETWCDELMLFGHNQGMIIVCPNGGPDGKIDDPIDTAFAGALLDSVINWYTVDTNRIYLMGFSWGGKTTYAYGLSHPERFAGYIVVGAAVGTAGDYSDRWQKANDKPWYLIHGTKDNMEVRFTPMKDSLIHFGAYVQSQLLAGVGHTFRFPKRELVLGHAFTWVDSVATQLADTNSTQQSREEGLLSTLPEVVRGGSVLEADYLMTQPGEINYHIEDVSGKSHFSETLKLGKGKHRIKIRTGEVPWGVYQIRFRSPNSTKIVKLMIRG